MFDHAQSPRLGQPTGVESPGVQLVTEETLPEVAYAGQIVYLLDLDQFRVYDGVAWQNPTAAATGGTQTFVGPDEPVADATGDLWMNNTTYQLYVWSGGQWRAVVDPAATAAASAASTAQAAAINALGLATAAQNTADGKITTFYTPAQPAAPDYSPRAGDLWINTVNNRLYRFSSPTSVDQVMDTAISTAINAAGTAQATADAKIQTYFTDTEPTGLGILDQGDLWFNTANGNAPSRWSGTGWVSIRDTSIAAAAAAASAANTAAGNALTAAQAAQATADGAVSTYYLAAPPWANNTVQPDTKLGDLWFNTTTNQAYRWNGTTWQLIQDNQIAAALSAASTAQTTADGKITAYYANTRPWADGSTGHAVDAGDIWYSLTEKNKPYYWNDTTKLWTAVRDATIADAQATADIKTLTFYVPSRIQDPLDSTKTIANPSLPVGVTIGDLWFDTYVDNLISRWDGAKWVPAQLGSAAIGTDAIGADHLSPMIPLGSTITTRTLDANGQPTGTGLDITPDGLTSYDANGDQRVVLPNNPLLPAVFRGDAEIDHLTVGTLTTLQETVLAQNSVMKLQSGVARPTFPPTPAVTWTTSKLANDSKWATRKYLASRGTDYWTISETSTDFSVEHWSGTNLANGMPWSSIFGGINGGDEKAQGIAHDGTNLWLLTYWVPNDGQQGYNLYRLDPTSFAITQEYPGKITGSGPENGQRSCAMAWDGVNSRLIVAQSRTTNSDFVRIHTITGTTGTAPAWSTLTNTNFAYPYNLSSLGYGPFDYNDATNRYFFQNYGTSNAPVTTTTGVRAPTFEWDNCWGYIGSVTAGTAWDPTTSKFVTINRAAQKVSYEGGTHWVGLTQGAESTWFAAYSWRGAPINFTATTTTGQTSITVSSTTGLNPGLIVTGAGIPANTSIVSVGAGAITLSAAATATAANVAMTTSQPETVASEGSPFTMLKRAKIILYAGALPNGVTGARFYMARGGSTTPDSLTAVYKSVGNSGGTAKLPSLTVTAPVFGPPYDNPIVSTFGSGVAAKLNSTKSDTNGALIQLAGDGSGRVGPLSWDTDGFPLTMPSDTTKQSLPIFNTLAAAFTRQATTFASAGMSITLPVGTYLFKVRGTYQSSVTTTGIAIRNGGTAITSALFGEVIIYGGANSTTAPWFSRVQTAQGQAVASTTGVQAANTANPFSIEGYCVVTTAGSLSVDIAGQDATGTVRLNAGTMIYAQKIA